MDKCSLVFGRFPLPSSGDGNHWLLVSRDPSGSCDNCVTLFPIDNEWSHMIRETEDIRNKS